MWKYSKPLNVVNTGINSGSVEHFGTTDTNLETKTDSIQVRKQLDELNMKGVVNLRAPFYL